MEQQGWGHWIRCEEEELIKTMLADLHMTNISVHDDLRELRVEYRQLTKELFKERQETQRLRQLLDQAEMSTVP